MSPFVALLIPVLTEGPLARVELSFEREPNDTSGRLTEVSVEDLGARLRADPRVADGGVRVEAGCSRARCSLVLDGLSASMPAGLDALKDDVSAPLPPLTYAQRRGLRREWRDAWRVPARAFDEVLRTLGEGRAPPPLAKEPRFPLFRGPPRKPLVWTELVAAGDVEHLGASWETAVKGLDALAPTNECGFRTTPEERPLPKRSVPIVILDTPGATRTTIGVAWLSRNTDTVRDVSVAGDFESRLVQRLRERDGLTYDVTPEYGEGWAGASFQVAPERIGEAVSAIREELPKAHEAGPEEIAGATRRLQARYAELSDTLAGRLALRRLPQPPLHPPAGFSEIEQLGFVVMGDLTRMGSFPDDNVAVTNSCTVLYGHPCPR